MKKYLNVALVCFFCISLHPVNASDIEEDYEEEVITSEFDEENLKDIAKYRKKKNKKKKNKESKEKILIPPQVDEDDDVILFLD